MSDKKTNEANVNNEQGLSVREKKQDTILHVKDEDVVFLGDIPKIPKEAVSVLLKPSNAKSSVMHTYWDLKKLDKELKGVVGSGVLNIPFDPKKKPYCSVVIRGLFYSFSIKVFKEGDEPKETFILIVPYINEDGVNIQMTLEISATLLVKKMKQINDFFLENNKVLKYTAFEIRYAGKRSKTTSQGQYNTFYMGLINGDGECVPEGIGFGKDEELQ